MHVLVTEARFGDSDRLVARLRELGIRVTGCHDRVQQCRALVPGQRCPVDDFVDPIDWQPDLTPAGWTMGRGHPPRLTLAARLTWLP